MDVRKAVETEASARFEGADGFVDLEAWRFHAGERILHARPMGYLLHEELVSMMSFLVDDPRFGATLPTLWNFRDFDFTAYSASEFRTHAFILPRFPDRAGTKRAYLVDSETAFGTLRMFQGTASGFSFEDQDNMMVSYNIEELVEWLIR